MAKKLSNLFFSTVKRAVRMQRRALKQVGVPAVKKARKTTKKKAVKRVAARRAARPTAAKVRVAGKGRWQSFVHTPVRSRIDSLRRLAYSLYFPKGHAVAGLPLVVMLHGCHQTPDDMAHGTRMNQLADQKGFVVAYPRQAKLIQAMRCWRWFQPDAGHGLAEADAIADLACTLVQKYQLNAARVYVSGLSAGASMAGLVGLRHADIFAAAALHSGAVIGASRDAVSGMRTMRQGGVGDPTQFVGPLLNDDSPFPGLPVMIVHGQRDRVVSVRNAIQLSQQFSYLNGAAAVKESVLGGGTHREYVRRDHVKDGRVAVRLCVLKEVGHAWSGGDDTLKYHSKQGPKASVLIWQFFSMYQRAVKKNI